LARRACQSWHRRPRRESVIQRAWCAAACANPGNREDSSPACKEGFRRCDPGNRDRRLAQWTAGAAALLSQRVSPVGVLQYAGAAILSVTRSAASRQPPTSNGATSAANLVIQLINPSCRVYQWRSHPTRAQAADLETLHIHHDKSGHSTIRFRLNSSRICSGNVRICKFS